MFIQRVVAFSPNKNSGNPAAVYVVRSFPSRQQMQNIATKESFSETSFICLKGDNLYYIRWFTPTSEAPICAHATLAAAFVLYNNSFVKKDKKIFFLNHKNIFTAWIEGNWISLLFPSYQVTSYVTSVTEKTLNTVQNILQGHKHLFIGVSKNVLFVELIDEVSVNFFKPNLALIKKLPFRALLITAQGTKYDFVSRYFAPSVGIDEDPVCGSAHCRLIPYWSHKLSLNHMIAYQSSKRTGVIRCENLKSSVVIKGQAAPM